MQSVACPHTQLLSMMPIVAFAFDLWPPKSREIILSPWLSAKFDEEAHNGLSCSQANFHKCQLWPYPLTSDLQNQYGPFSHYG